MKKRTIVQLVMIIMVTTLSDAAEFYADRQSGADSNPGSKVAPFKTITRGAKVLAPGDTLHVVPGKKPWRETANLYGLKGGEPGKPITIDGHGVWLSGADPVLTEGWQKEPAGLWSHRGMNYTGFLVVEGKLILETMSYTVLKPGELCYSVKAFNRLFYKPAKKTVPAIMVTQPNGQSLSLAPTQWQQSGLPGEILRYNGLKRPTELSVEGIKMPLVEAKDRLAPGQFSVHNKTLYYRPPAGKQPSEMTIEAVIRTNGIQLAGQTRHVVIRNFNIKHVANDGYNIHSNVKNAEFYNCNASSCGDEGFSSHSKAETLLDGAVYVNCENGINNVHNTKSISRNVICARSRLTGYEGQSLSEHRVENLILIDNPQQLNASCGLFEGDNILILRTENGPRTTAFSGVNALSLKRITIINNTTLCRLVGKLSCSLTEGIIGAGQGVMHVRQDSPATVLRFKNVTGGDSLTLEYGSKAPFTRTPFAKWVKTTGVTGVTAGNTDGLINLTRGEMPTIVPEGGCTPELLQRAIRFLKDVPDPN